MSGNSEFPPQRPRRSGLDCIGINIDQISTMEPIPGASATRIIMQDGRRYIVDDEPDFLWDRLYEWRKGSEENGWNPMRVDLFLFDLIKVERQAQSWLGRAFIDAVNFVRGDRPALPPFPKSDIAPQL